MPTIQANKTRAEAQDAYMHTEAQEQQPDDFLSVLVDAREYDVPYYVRCSIDLDIRCSVVQVCVCVFLCMCACVRVFLCFYSVYLFWTPVHTFSVDTGASAGVAQEGGQ